MELLRLALEEIADLKEKLQINLHRVLVAFQV
jgi:hypothetical protein